MAISIIILVEFVFSDIPELFNGGERLGEILVNISLSYIAAYFFYIVTFLIPKRIERKHIEEHAAHLINMVLFYILFIMQDAANMKIPQMDLKLRDISEDEFTEAMKDVFMDNELKHFKTGKDGHNQKVGAAVINSIEKLKNTIDELFRYSPHIEPELIASINAATRNVMNESWKNSYLMTPAHIGGITLVAKRIDVSCYAKHIHEYQQQYRSIEKIFLKNYASTEAVKKYSENIRNLKKLTF